MKQANKGKPVDERPFITIRECPARTGLSETFVRQMYQKGELPHVMVGNRCMVNVPKLLELMDQKSMKAIV